MSYSFTGSLNDERSYQASARPSEKQLVAYQKMCAQRNIEPQDVSRLTRAQLSKLIDQVKEIPSPATEAQIEKIKSMHQAILDMGVSIKPIPQEFLDSLTSGRDGTASQVIQLMYRRLEEAKLIAPPTEKQLQVLVSWFFCPDIPFESLTIVDEPESKVVEISRRQYLEPIHAFSTDHDSVDEFEQRPWRLVTPQEFAERIKAVLTSNDASKLIDQYRGVFYEWRKTRITQEQMRQIRKLEERMSVTYTPQRVEFAMTEEGDLIEIGTPSRKRRSTIGYVPLAEESLIQMSVEDASRFIDQLKAEVSRKELRDGSLPHDESQQTLNDKFRKFDERNVTGEARDMVGANVKEVRMTEDLIYALESVVGYRADELHDLINENMVLYGAQGFRSEDFADRMRRMMRDSIDTSRDMAQIFKDIARLTVLCEQSAFATALAKEVVKEVMLSIEL